MFASVIIPCYNREKTIDRAIGSIANQSIFRAKKNWEVLVIDDASTDKTKERIIAWEEKYPKNVIGIKFNEHKERVIATNSGITYARGDWVIRLDSDDELAGHFIQAFEDAVKMYPDAKLFTWGSLMHVRNKDAQYYRTEVKPAYQPPTDEDGNILPFKSGGIRFGSFAFKKELIWTTHFLPTVSNCYSLGEWALKRFPELIPLYTELDGRVHHDLGNPFGDDFILFYMLCKVALPIPLNQVLHSVHVRL